MLKTEIYRISFGCIGTLNCLPLWPQGNSNAESSTPHVATKIAPCELLFNRKIQGNLPELVTKQVVDKHQMAKNKQCYDNKKHTKKSFLKVGDILIY